MWWFLMLKVVVGKPVLELLNHAKELAQGSGNFKSSYFS
ncbi:putative HAMP containing membrane protein [Campylobacter jejuni HB-CJGB-ZX]|nr:putative HAMP containing membrane protein [Campylobacter jejuni HB-CJGB-LL]PNS89554.1 putative HAMP containing membrane protein [Campylobacter jejuni HB-CJGB-ZX]